MRQPVAVDPGKVASGLLHALRRGKSGCCAEMRHETESAGRRHKAVGKVSDVPEKGTRGAGKSRGHSPPVVPDVLQRSTWLWEK